MLAILICLLFSFYARSGLATRSRPTVYQDLPCKFSLAAWNVTRHNANSTGVPLVLGQDGATDGASYEVTSTSASYPYNVYPLVSLSDGSLRAYRASGVWLTNATALVSGGLLSWFTSALFDREAARIYTALEFHNPTRLRVLAAHGIYDRWSLCPFDGTLAQTSVVFNVSADEGMPGLGFDPSRCWAVRIQLVPADTC
ncbi:hypothetical protein B0H15DRAFT_899860 [Mycena belliarum]|uniref:Uncharacterized protein n=1 Tax=Mycena belliarum TaxID=1033014 RepID=A0AAD6ULT4_9AGAR|nr:hypothetical protein B0H15DRAFT_899860 [Mycena belliae]